MKPGTVLPLPSVAAPRWWWRPWPCTLRAPCAAADLCWQGATVFGPSAQAESGGIDSHILRLVLSAIGAVAIPALSWFAWDGFMDHALDPDRGSEHVTLAPGATGMLEDNLTGTKTLKVTIVATKPSVHVSTNDLGAPGPGEELWGVEIKVQNLGPAAAYSPV